MYKCFWCRLQMVGPQTRLEGTDCPLCKGPIFPMEERPSVVKVDKEKVEIKLVYLEELRNLADTHRFVTDGTLVERVHRVCDSIEEDLELSGT
ncbi:hypothetical protein P9597_02405 [Aneurinibacillus migulanus]|uniref:hypothetical protein n=1 Tax=Aneurinibacillus migulanus TaxID=47500 RepID=UPI002E1F21C8|nr:hypothetical protein [Aneurinibacillus migulanus]